MTTGAKSLPTSPTAAGSAPGFTSTVISARLSFSNGWMLALTLTATFSSRTSALSSREEPSPPNTAMARSSCGRSAELTPGTTQLR